MKVSIACAIAFAAGVAVGSFGALQLLKTKYEQIAQDRIDEYYDSIKDKLSRPAVVEEAPEAINDNEENANKAKSDQTKPSIHEYASMIKNFNYSALSENPSEPEEQIEPDMVPYTVIPPDEFGERDGYNTETLYYYNDEVLMDGDDNIIDPETTVGLDSLDSFGEYEDDATYVRNDELRTDYEILLRDDNSPSVS